MLPAVGGVRLGSSTTVAAPSPDELLVTTEAWWVAHVRWILLSVGLGVVPILGTVLFEVIVDARDPLAPAMSHGQLLIAAVGLSGSSLSRLIRKAMSDAAIAVGALCIVQALVGTFLFAMIAVAASQQATGIPHADRLVALSIAWWLFAVVVGSACVRIVRA